MIEVFDPRTPEIVVARTHTVLGAKIVIALRSQVHRLYYGYGVPALWLDYAEEGQGWLTDYPVTGSAS